MSYSPEFLDEMKKRLEEEQKELQTQLGGVADKKGAHYEARFEDVGDDRDNNAQESQNFADDVALESTLEKQLGRVNAALAKIEDGTYGMVNGEEVPQARLEANPAAGAGIED